MKKTILNISILFIIIFNIEYMINGYYLFYYPDEKPYNKKNLLNYSFTYLTEIPVINFLAKYTGLNGGFGLFAPNVASDVIFDFELKGINIKSKKNISSFKYNNYETYQRMVSAELTFLELIGKNKFDTTNLEIKKRENSIKRHCK